MVLSTYKILQKNDIIYHWKKSELLFIDLDHFDIVSTFMYNATVYQVICLKLKWKCWD